MEMDVATQADIYLMSLQTRKRGTAKASTLAAYQSYLKNWIVPNIGNLDLGEVKNGTLKKLVTTMADAGLSPATIAGVTNCVKGIINSAVSEEGDYLYPVKWNHEFIDSPPVNARDQESPMIGPLEVRTAILAVSGQYRPLLALLAGTGCRISEALAIKKGPCPDSSYWDPARAIVSISTQIYRGQEQSPKTAAGFREIDLAPSLNDFLTCNFNLKPASELLFCDENKEPLTLSAVYRATASANIPGFHSFRRFRTTHLRSMRVPEDIIQFWIGHSGKSITDRYSKMAQNIEERKKYAVEAGLGFELPEAQ